MVYLNNEKEGRKVLGRLGSRGRKPFSYFKHAFMTGYHLIEDQGGLDAFASQNKGIDWMCFDTEFVGEKRFFTRLCLMQVATRFGNYLIDPFPIPDLGPVLRMIQDPAIVKVTHAGENDYRLLFGLYGILPANVFDTQIAAGFMGFKYPVSFKRLVEAELRVNLKKGYTVADWESRPFKTSQLEYALEDVLPLHPLWEAQQEKLRQLGHLSWAMEEFRELEKEGYYAKDPYHEALHSQLMRSLNKKEQVFLLRLFEWRKQQAQKRNHSREMILSSKLIPHIVKGIRSGKEALLDNRRVPSKLIQDHWGVFEELFQATPTTDEKRLLKRIQGEEEDNPREEILIELLYLIVRHHCLDSGISSNIALPRNLLRKIQEEPAQARELFGKGWRSELLGARFAQWFEEFQRMNIHILDNRIELRLDND